MFVGLEMTQDKEVNLPEGLTYIPDLIYFRIAKNDLFFRSVTENTIIKYNQ